jgi:membrane protein YdbS with pleckstrin-like domain
MSKQKKELYYSMETTMAFIIQWLVIVLLFDLLLFCLVYFLIRPFYLLDAENWLTITVWSIYLVISMGILMTVYFIANSHRYLLNRDQIEIINIIRPKKRRIIKLENVSNIRIRQTPIISQWFNFGTIILYKKDEKNREKVVARLLGINHPDLVFLDLVELIGGDEELHDEIIKEFLK